MGRLFFDPSLPQFGWPLCVLFTFSLPSSLHFSSIHRPPLSVCPHPIRSDPSHSCRSPFPVPFLSLRLARPPRPLAVSRLDSPSPLVSLPPSVRPSVRHVRAQAHHESTNTHMSTHEHDGHTRMDAAPSAADWSDWTDESLTDGSHPPTATGSRRPLASSLVHSLTRSFLIISIFSLCLCSCGLLPCLLVVAGVQGAERQSVPGRLVHRAAQER